MGNEMRRCETIPVNAEWWSDPTLGELVPRLRREAGSSLHLETCDVTSYYGVTGQAAKDLFVGSADDIRARLQQLEAQAPPPIDAGEVERWVDVLRASLVALQDSAPMRNAAEWLDATRKTIPPRAADLKTRVQPIDTEYTAIAGRLTRTSKADVTTRTTTTDVTQLVEEYKQWIATQREVLADRLAQDASFETSARIGNIRFLMDASLGQLKFEGDARSGNRRFEGDAAHGSQQFNIDAAIGQLRFVLKGQAGKLDVDLSSIPIALAMELGSEIDTAVGPNVAGALNDAGRIFGGDYRPRHRLGYASIVAVLKTELPDALVRLEAAMPGILERLTTSRAAHFTAWEGKRDTKLGEATQAGRDFETRMNTRLTTDRDRGSTQATTQAEQIRDRIRTDQQRIQGMIDALPKAGSTPRAPE